MCRCLGVGAIPEWITSLAGTGAAIADTGEYVEMRRRMISARISRRLEAEVCADVCAPGCLPSLCVSGGQPRSRRTFVSCDESGCGVPEYLPMQSMSSLTA